MVTVISITPKQFLSLMTQDEVVAIQRSDIPAVIYMRTMCLASERIRGDDEDLLAGLPALMTLGLLSQESFGRIKQKLKLAQSDE
jgi:hypothetical protein